MIRGAMNTPQAKPAGWRQYRQEITFLAIFLLVLGGGFTVLSINWVNDHLVEPFTGGIATISAAVLNVLGQGITQNGTVLTGSRFAVNIRNGCNGVEALIIFVAAVLAFPATWRSRVIGLALGTLAIQVINLVRVVALFLTGAYIPKLFESSHTVIWQSIVILCAVLLWIYWANRYAVRPGEATGGQEAA